MKTAFTLRRLTTFVWTIALVWFGAVACEMYDGDLPPTDRIELPTALGLHPSGDYLYVLSSNYDSDYRQDLGGTLSIIDLNTLTLLTDRTLCVPSFGSSLTFSFSAFDNHAPRYLVATSKSSRGAFTLALNQEGDEIACNYQGKSIGNTCVGDIATLDGVSKKYRKLPCEVPNIMNDPSAITPIPPVPGVTPANQDAFMIVGQGNGDIAALNLVDGETRGQDAQEEQDDHLYVTKRYSGFVKGANALATHPITGDIYVGGRSDRHIYSARWLRKPPPTVLQAPDAGFVERPTRHGTVELKPTLDDLEIRSLQFSNDGTRLWATSQSPGSIFEIDTSLNEEGRPRNHEIRRMLVPGKLMNFAIIERQDITYAYIAVFDKRQIAVVDLTHGVRVDTIDVGSTPYSLIADPSRARIYAAMFEDNAVMVIDADPTHATWNRTLATIH